MNNKKKYISIIFLIIILISSVGIFSYFMIKNYNINHKYDYIKDDRRKVLVSLEKKYFSYLSTGIISNSQDYINLGMKYAYNGNNIEYFSYQSDDEQKNIPETFINYNRHFKYHLEDDTKVDDDMDKEVESLNKIIKQLVLDSTYIATEDDIVYMKLNDELYHSFINDIRNTSEVDDYLSNYLDNYNEETTYEKISFMASFDPKTDKLTGIFVTSFDDSFYPINIVMEDYNVDF